MGVYGRTASSGVPGTRSSRHAHVGRLSAWPDTRQEGQVGCCGAAAATAGRRVGTFWQPERVERGVVVVLSLGDEGQIEPAGGQGAARGVLQRARAPPQLPGASKRARTTEEAEHAIQHTKCKVGLVDKNENSLATPLLGKRKVTLGTCKGGLSEQEHI